METEPSDHVRELFFAVLDLPSPERARFLDQHCNDDLELRRQVEFLLRHHEAAEDAAYMVAPRAVRDLEATAPHEHPEHLKGRRIGRYEITSVIATGGMGTVYEAVQDHPHRRVAIKVLRRGATFRDAMKRFQHEAEILGQLRHPNIAQIYDAGTLDEGEGARPYFVMELVDGRPLLEHAESSGLGERGRLELFIEICHAVQYAHHRGVIHRDLKPDNILVDKLDEPKILDFGVARATGSDIQVTTLCTEAGQLIGTVPYMSPEQVIGDPHEVDLRSDVYALGAVLYELLCGRLPHALEDRSIPEMAHVIREEDPTPLGSVNAMFRGDVETIVAKAMERDKDRRYQSAAELAADLRHYLMDEPIVARPPSTFYQLRKFARRNKPIVGGLVASLVILLAGVLGVTWQLLETREEAAKARAINEFLMGLFVLANPGESLDELGDAARGGQALTLEELIDEATLGLETSLQEWPAERADILFQLGKTHYGLGNETKMESCMARAYELRSEALGADHPDTLQALVWLGSALQLDAREVEADAMFRRAAAGLEMRLGAADPRTISANVWLARNLGRQGRFREAEIHFRTTIEVARRAQGDRHRSTLSAVYHFADALKRMERPAEIEREVSPALKTARNSLPPGDLLTASLARSLGDALQAQGRLNEAVACYEEAAECYRAKGADTTGTAVLLSYEWARALRALDRASEAEAVLRTQLATLERKVARHEQSTADALFNLARHLWVETRYDEAETLLRDRYDGFADALGQDNLWVIILD